MKDDFFRSRVPSTFSYITAPFSVQSKGRCLSPHSVHILGTRVRILDLFVNDSYGKFFCKFRIILLCVVYVCVGNECADAHVCCMICGGQGTPLRSQSVLSFLGFWGLNSGHQVCTPSVFPTELPCGPCPGLFFPFLLREVLNT